MRISEAIEKALNGWGIARDTAEAEAARLAEQYPEAAEWEAQFTAWVAGNATAQLNVATLTATLSGIARDIWNGNAGKDAEAFHGNV